MRFLDSLQDGGYNVHALMWWNGRHRGLKIPCCKACGFESRHQHHHPHFSNVFFRKMGII